jgi:hypothetical protein
MRIALLVLVVAVLAGCQDEKTMTPDEAANFKGSPGTPMTDQKKKAMEDFRAEFEKKHPTQGKN